MVFKALLYATRKAGITPAEFKTHYDTVHLPLIKSLAGDTLPIYHKRSYLARPLAGEDNSYPAAVVLGTQDDFTYDCITEIAFENEEGFKVFFGKRMQPGIKEVIDADEEKFLDSTKVKVVILGDVSETFF
ncbi:EthD domain-containing protein [Aspergillus pseudodeflectus]|uniref:EthD domain-containing protein n=1 Tax=Aspergillus pseudodeflectus TaxID=176178 RepID=A0ABR4K3W5_9EURO